MLRIVPVTRTHDIRHGPGHKIQLAIKASAQALEQSVTTDQRIVYSRRGKMGKIIERQKKNTSTTATAITRERKEASSFT